MEGTDLPLPVEVAAPAKPGRAAFVRLCLGFVGGWWLLQLALLGTGMIAIDRVQSQLASERVADLGAILQLALGQAPGKLPVARFDAQASALLESDPTLVAVLLLDGKGVVQRRAGKGWAGAGAANGVPAQALRLPVTGGTIALAIDPNAANAGAWKRRTIFIGAAMAVPFLFLPVTLWLRRNLATTRNLPWMTINAVTGIVTSFLLVGSLLDEAHTNAMVKAAATDKSMTIAVKETLAPTTVDLRRLNRLLAGYQALDSRMDRVDLSFALATQANGSSRFWEQAQRIPLEGGETLAILRHWPPIEATPAVVRGAKNLVVLILAVALLCTVMAGTQAGFKLPMAALRRPAAKDDWGAFALEAIRPIYFLAVLAENLCAPFLPRVLHDAVAQAQLPPEMASALFMAYFFAFTGVLLPAGWLVGRFGENGLIRGGAFLLATGLFLPSLSLDATSLMAARLLAGAGQGILLIGVQSLILSNTNAKGRTAGTSIIVFGFNGGMVGGNAFGSLLVERIGPQAVFAVAGTVALTVTLIALVILAKRAAPAPATATGEPAPKRTGRGLDLGGLRCLLNPGFLLTTVCIGIPTKAVLTGVVLFALPLILSHRGFNLEEVGQIAMFYAAGVLAATTIVSKLSNRQKRSGGSRLTTGTILTTGALLSAVGMASVMVVDMPLFAGSQTVILIGCILLLGMAHGCINAPVVTHVADLPIAHQLGPVRVATSYRLVERIGHIGGPLVVERVLAVSGHESQALAWIALVVAAAALVFVVQDKRRRV